MEFEIETPGQVAFGISKKKAKKATDRNRIKRLMREVYRVRKHEIYECSEQKYAMILICLNPENITFKKLEQSFDTIVKKFIQDEVQ